MNSVSESLYFSVPLVMVPQTTEQKAVAERVLQIGAGVMLKKTDEKTIFESIEIVLSEESYRKNAKAVSEGFKRCKGAVGAVDKILAVCTG